MVLLKKVGGMEIDLTYGRGREAGFLYLQFSLSGLSSKDKKCSSCGSLERSWCFGWFSKGGGSLSVECWSAGWVLTETNRSLKEFDMHWMGFVDSCFVLLFLEPFLREVMFSLGPHRSMLKVLHQDPGVRDT